MKENADVIVIGAGASGMSAAIAAAGRGRSVILLEKNGVAGRKLAVTGSGRCNLMNLGSPRYFGGKAFAEKTLKRKTQAMLASFWHDIGLETRVEDERRVYPAAGLASVVNDTLRLAMISRGVILKTGIRAEKVCKTNGLYSAVAGEDIYSAPLLILACGGKSQPKTGACGDGYVFAESFGHTVTELKPGLAPIVTDKRSVSWLAGIRVKTGITLLSQGVPVRTEHGEALFTEDGLSGICAMSLARDVNGTDQELCLDLLYGTAIDNKEIINEIKRRRELFSSLPAQEILSGLMHPRLAFAVCKQSGLALHGEKAGDLPDDAAWRIAETLRGYRMRVAGTKGFDMCQVTAGGVECDEVDPETMSSRLLRGLYITGELLNVDGDCGGYNLMFAFASGLIAGESAAAEN